MALPATLFRFKIELSDVDRGVYESLDFRVAQHPSESATYLLTRVIAYVLNYQEGLEFSPQGLSDPDAPALRSLSANGNLELWIEVGNASARKLHKAAKAANLVKVYTYKDPQALIRELASQHVHKLETIEFYSIKPKVLESLETHLERENKWGMVHMEGTLSVNLKEGSEQIEITRHKIEN